MKLISRRKYNIQSYLPDAPFEGDYCTGKLANSSQIILGVQFPQLVLLNFDASGGYLGYSSFELPPLLRSPAAIHSFSLCDLPKVIELQSESGLIPSSISVYSFFVSELQIGIEDLPEHYVEFLKHPECFDDDEGIEWRTSISQWQEEENFVFFWGNDYYLNKQGECQSS